jgi:hypothetical protein
MRKRIRPDIARRLSSLDEHWLDLENVAQVEVTSEDPEHPVESALVRGEEGGWRAADAGQQTIRLIFDRPQEVKRVRVVFDEHEAERTQEFVLRWSAGAGEPLRDIVRQQWNFSPSGATTEVEDYRVELHGVVLLELKITPDKSGGDAHASLQELRVG